MSFHWVAAGAFLLLSFGTGLAQGQSGTPGHFESRQDLERRAREAEAANRSGEAWLLKSRLQRGDFQEGDRIVIVVQNPTPSRDTFTVRTGKVIQLPRMDDFQLEGVLRSELNDRLTAHIGRFLRDPQLRAQPLLRVAVLGRVGRPGFYYAAADVVLSDLIMLAGGPAGDADLSKIVIRRGPEVIWTADDTRTAIAEGLSLDRLHLRAGDEVDVGARRRVAWTTVVPLVTSVTALVVTLIRSF